MPEPLSETVRRAQAGDQAAIATLVAEQQRYVYSIAMSITRDPADAADLTQDALIRFIRAIGSYRGETKLSTWLYRLVVNLGIDRMRRRGAPPIRLDDEGVDVDVASDDPIDDVAAVAERAEEAQIVRAAVSKLPDAQRLALTLHYFEDQRYEDIAEVMGVPLNTVKSHIRRGKERLAVLLAPALEEPRRAGSLLMDDRQLWDRTTARLGARPRRPGPARRWSIDPPADVQRSILAAVLQATCQPDADHGRRCRRSRRPPDPACGVPAARRRPRSLRGGPLLAPGPLRRGPAGSRRC